MVHYVPGLLKSSEVNIDPSKVADSVASLVRETIQNWATYSLTERYTKSKEIENLYQETKGPWPKGALYHVILRHLFRMYDPRLQESGTSDQAATLAEGDASKLWPVSTWNNLYPIMVDPCKNDLLDLVEKHGWGVSTVCALITYANDICRKKDPKGGKRSSIRREVILKWAGKATRPSRTSVDSMYVEFGLPPKVRPQIKMSKPQEDSLSNIDVMLEEFDRLVTREGFSATDAYAAKAEILATIQGLFLARKGARNSDAWSMYTTQCNRLGLQPKPKTLVTPAELKKAFKAKVGAAYDLAQGEDPEAKKEYNALLYAKKYVTEFNYLHQQDHEHVNITG